MVSMGDRSTPPRVTLPVVKVRAGSLVRCWLLGVPPLWVDTHWLDRQFICPGSPCPACNVAPLRTHGYVAVALGGGAERMRPAMLEVSPSAWSRVAGLSQMESLRLERGLMIECTRRFAKSPLVVTPVAAIVPPELPACTPAGMLQALAVLYHLPVPMDGESAVDWAERAKPAAERLVTQALA